MLLPTTPEQLAREVKANKWWKGLSYNEQDAILQKYGEYYQILHRYNNLSLFKIAEIMEKEGV